MIILIKKIPFVIIINHIIPYTYNIQPNFLLEDIKNYYFIKEILMKNIYDFNLIKHEIFAIFYTNNNILLNILSRYYSYLILKKISKDINDNIYRYTTDKRFSILFGLFTKDERIKFLEHILEDDGIWFKKKMLNTKLLFILHIKS